MDNVNKPNHYMLDGIPGVEVKDVIKAVLGEDTVGFYLGNVLKYMLRFKKKNGLEDLKKARLYLDWAIEDYGEDVPVSNTIKTQLLEDILKHTTIYTHDGLRDKVVYTDPVTSEKVSVDLDDEDILNTITIDKAFSKKPDISKKSGIFKMGAEYDEYMMDRIVASESKKFKESSNEDDKYDEEAKNEEESGENS